MIILHKTHQETICDIKDCNLPTKEYIEVATGFGKLYICEYCQKQLAKAIIHEKMQKAKK